MSRPLQPQYFGHLSGATILSCDDIARLQEWLSKLTGEGGDRVAGGHPVLAASFLPTQAHVLIRCNRDALNQVIGRIKSRLATLLLFEPQWSQRGRRIWARGFWAAEISSDDVGDQVKKFIEARGQRPSVAGRTEPTAS